MRFVAGRGAVAERHREDTAGWGRRARAVAGRGAVAERHREVVAGRGTAAKRHREAVAGWGAVAKSRREAVAGRSSMRGDNAAASGSSCGGLPFKVALVVFCPLFGKKAPSGDKLRG